MSDETINKMARAMWQATVRIAELEAENATLRLALEASVAFAKHVQEFLYINDYGDYELGSGFENNTDETIKVADSALNGDEL